MRITLRRPGAAGTVAYDTVIAFPSGADSLVLDARVPVHGLFEQFDLYLRMIRNPADTVFASGPDPVTATAGAPTQIAPRLRYVGVGSKARDVVFQTAPAQVFFGDTALFLAVARDSGGVPIPGTPIQYSSSDSSRARVPADSIGRVVGRASRGSVTITATLLTNQTATAPLVVQPVPAALGVLSGNGQSGAVGGALAQPITVRVKAADSLGVQGVIVSFAVTTGGGTLSQATDTTDAGGDASTAWTLGGTPGAQALRVTAAGLTGVSVNVSATGVVGAATRLAFQGQPPAGTIYQSPFGFTVVAQDAFGNTAGTFNGTVTVALGTNPGGGTLTGTLSQTASAGIATFGGISIDNIAAGYTLNATAAGLTPGASNAFAIVAPANVNAWINTAGGNWGTAGNWSRGAVPTATDTVVIRQSGTYTVNLDVNATVARLDVGAPLGAQTLAVAANALTMAGNGAFTPRGTLTLSGSGTIAGPGTLDLGGAFNWLGGSVGGSGGTTRVLAGGTLNIAPAAALTLQNHTLELAGTGTWTGTAAVNTGNAGVLRVLSGATLSVAGDPTFAFSLGGAAPLLDNQGTVNRTTSTNAFVVSAPVGGAGDWNVQSGTLDLSGGGTSTGATSVASGATLRFGAGTLAYGAASAITGAGTVTVSGGAITFAGGYGVTGPTQVSSGTASFGTAAGTAGSLGVSGGTLAVTGALAVSGATTWSGGAIQVPAGSLRLLGGSAGGFAGTATVGGGASLELGGGTFTLSGNVQVNGPLLISAGTAVLGGHFLGVTGAFATSGAGALQMTLAGDSLDIGGNATFGGAAGTLSSGVIRVAGNLTQAGSTGFAPGPNTSAQHVTLAGTGTQTVSFANPAGNGFRRLLIQKPAATSVVLGSDVRVGLVSIANGNAVTITGLAGPPLTRLLADTIAGQSTAGAIVSPLVIDVAGVLSDSGGINVDTVVFSGSGQAIRTVGTGGLGTYSYRSIRVAQSAGTATIGTTPLSLANDLTVSAGTLSLNGARVAVAGNFRTESSGVLQMTGTAADSLGVGGNATFVGGSTAGLLTAGIITVGGNFAQSGNAAAFAPSTAHRVRFQGAPPATQTIGFANPATSFFDSLIVDRGVGARATVQLLSDVRVNRGMRVVNSTDITGPAARLTIAGGTLQAVLSTTSPTMTSLRAIELSQTPLIGTSPVNVSPDTMVFNGAIANLPVSSGLHYNNVRVSTGGAFTSPGNVTFNGDLIVTSGTYTIGSGIDSIGGFLRTENTGAFSMVAIAASPTVAVRDSAVFAGGPSTGLTGGLLRVHGSFVQRGAANAFAAGGTHRVAFVRAAAGTQTIAFQDPANSFFRDLLLNRPIADTVRLLADVRVGDSATVTGSTILASTGLEALRLPATGVLRAPNSLAVIRASRVEFGTLQVDSAFVGSARIMPDTAVFLNGGSITSSSPAYAWRSVRLAAGTLTTGGTRYAGNLILSGGTYTFQTFGATDSISGFLRTEGSGVLQMPLGTAPPTMIVQDSAVFSGGSTAGTLVSGTLRLRGNFVQRGGGNAFQAGTGHTTVFAGATRQSVTFANPGTGAAQSTFGNLFVGRSVAAVAQPTAVVLGSAVFAAGQVQDTSAGAADTIIGLTSADSVSANGLSLTNTVFNGAPLVVNGGLVITGNTITFQNMNPAVNQLTFNRGAAFSVNALTFATTPNAGVFMLVVNNLLAGAPITATITASAPSAAVMQSGPYYHKLGATLPIISWNGVTLLP